MSKMGIPINRINVSDEEARSIIRASLGDKLIGNIHDFDLEPKPIHSKFDFIWKLKGDKNDS